MCSRSPNYPRDVTRAESGSWEGRDIDIITYVTYMLHVTHYISQHYHVLVSAVQAAPAREKPWVRPGLGRLRCLTNLAFGNSTGHFLLSYRFGLDPTFYTLHTY